MSISFHSYQECAVKVSVCGKQNCASEIYYTGVNLITGHPSDKAPPSTVTQDCLALPRQPWLDGISEPGVVRQFVAMPLGQVEEQIAGQVKIGSIHIDVFPSFNSAVSFHSRAKADCDISLSPHQLSVDAGEFIEMNVK